MQFPSRKMTFGLPALSAAHLKLKRTDETTVGIQLLLKSSFSVSMRETGQAMYEAEND